MARQRGYLKNSGHEIGEKEQFRFHDGYRLTRWNPDIRKNTCNKEQMPAASLSSRRIVLLGQTGVGKSAAGNTILGQKVFRSEMRMRAVTCECSGKHATVSGRSVSVVDTPPFFDTEMNTEEIITEIARSVYLSSPGPHAFLIVLRANDRFTEKEQEIPQTIKMLFGQEVLKYSIILFTHGDQIDGETVEVRIKEINILRDLVDQCGGRYHVFNNKEQNNREQVNDLLQKIDTMIKDNGGGHYSNEIFEDAERFRREEEEQKQRDEEKKTSSEFTAFYTNNRYYFAAAVATAGIVVFGIAIAAVFFSAKAQHTQRNQRKEQERKKQ